MTTQSSCFLIWALLETYVGLEGIALHLLLSYLSSRTFSVVIKNACSSVAHFNRGVPQESILGPLSIYCICFLSAKSFRTTISPTTVMQMTHSIGEGLSNSSCLDNLFACLCYMKCWMSQNFLKFNDDKSEVKVFGPTDSTSLLHSKLGSPTKNIKQAFFSSRKSPRSGHSYLPLICIKS